MFGISSGHGRVGERERRGLGSIERDPAHPERSEETGGFFAGDNKAALGASRKIVVRTEAHSSGVPDGPAARRESRRTRTTSQSRGPTAFQNACRLGMTRVSGLRSSGRRPYINAQW